MRIPLLSAMILLAAVSARAETATVQPTLPADINDCTSKQAFFDAWNPVNASITADANAVQAFLRALPSPMYAEAEWGWNNEVNVRNVYNQGIARTCPNGCQDCDDNQMKICQDYQACFSKVPSAVTQLQNIFRTEQSYLSRSGPHPGFADCNATGQPCWGGTPYNKLIACVGDLQNATSLEQQAVTLIKQLQDSFSSNAACQNPAFPDLLGWQNDVAAGILKTLGPDPCHPRGEPAKPSCGGADLSTTDDFISKFQALGSAGNIIPADRGLVKNGVAPAAIQYFQSYEKAVSAATDQKLLAAKDYLSAVNYLGGACVYSNKQFTAFQRLAQSVVCEAPPAPPQDPMYQ